MPRGGKRPGTGGKRPGAGRKKGAATKCTRKTTALAEQQAGEGILPLAVLLEVMRKHHAAGNLDKAAAIARDAAPYLHRRLSGVQHDITFTDSSADEALNGELERLAARRQGKGAGKGEAPG